MTKHRLIFCLLLFVSAYVSAQTVLRIDGKDISKQEFEYYFHKNRTAGEFDSISVKDYTDLFVKFKLKVAEAYHQGLDTLPAFRKEFNSYRSQLVMPYLTDAAFNDSLLWEAYRMMQEEVDVSHILLKVEGKDTLNVYNKAMALKKQLNPSNFSAMADSFSIDPTVQYNHGRLGFITGDKVLYAFAKAAYATPVGKISDPVRTSYGYHLILVNQRRPSTGSVQVRHILIKKPENADSAQIAEAAKQADHVYGLALHNRDFASLAKKYSEDAENAEQGGLLPWISCGSTNTYFEDAALVLRDSGQIAPLVTAPYGWHIIQLEAHRPLPPLDSLRLRLENRIHSDERQLMMQSHFIDQLKKEYHFQHGTDSIIGTFAQQTLTKKDLEAFCKDHPRIADSVNAYINYALLNYEDSRLEEKYPDFQCLTNEYKEGILLFNISSQEVWNKAAADTAALRTYFEQHKEDYAGRAPGKTDPSSYKEVKGWVINDYQKVVEEAWINELRKKHPVVIYQEELDKVR